MVGCGPLVSVVIPFFKTPVAFLREAIESVFAQTYPHWEVLLVDDGSGDASSTLARAYASRTAEQVRYLEHPESQNCGISLSRQLGVDQARGKYVAFLDSDDVWLPGKLADQVGIMEACPEAGLLYGRTLYWSTWSATASRTTGDFVPKLGVTPNRIIRPPSLLPMFLQGHAAVPCPCSVLVRKEVLTLTGGFEGSFRHLYEDQVFYAKVCLAFPVYVSGACWDKYRQHPESATATIVGKLERAARVDFLMWLRGYLIDRGEAHGVVWRTVERELWLAGRSPYVRRALKPVRRLLRALAQSPPIG